MFKKEIELEIIELSSEVTALLKKLNAPERLVKHLTIVHSVTFEIISKFKDEWPDLVLKEKETLFGASTHDVGKTKIRSELYEKGSTHKLEGYKMLKDFGYPEELSRFAKTHGNWKNGNLDMEDLIVCVSDKIWKGQRINDLEELICKKLSDSLLLKYWDVYTKLDLIFGTIALEAEKRLIWQLQ